MKYFIKKSAKWAAFLVLTVLFFSLPVVLRDCEGGHDADLPTDLYVPQIAGLVFEFVPGYTADTIEGDSTTLRMITRTDTSRKEVHLFVNGEKQDDAVVFDSMVVEFPRVHLREGRNEIAAILMASGGEVLAVRKKRIFFQKKL